MNIEVRELMNDNEMLSHIFLGCIPREQLESIRDKYVGDIDWQKESVKIPVTMNIGGVDVNPKDFFDNWKSQMGRIIKDEASKMLSDKMGSEKMVELANKIIGLSEVIDSMESEINWEVPNVFE